MQVLKSLAAAALIGASASTAALQIDYVGSFGPGVEGGAEIAAFDPTTVRLFVTNSDSNSLDRYDLSDPVAPVTLGSLDLSPFGAAPNSVAVADGLVAVAVEAAPAQDPGVIVFFDADGVLLGQVTVGALPDMVTFTPDGSRLLVANEGEPNDDYTIDPEGSVSIIDLSGSVAAATVQTAGFADFNAGGPLAGDLPADVRIFGPGATVAQDLEPEYISTDELGTTAWVTLQENNAVAVVDIASATVIGIVALGFKDHTLPTNPLDASDEDGPMAAPAINITNWPVLGMYQPDAISTMTIGGVPYLFTANEGDARDYDGYSEEDRIGDVTLDPTAFPDAAILQSNANLGRLNMTLANGDADADNDYDQLYVYGGRSFSVWNGLTGALVWDSGSEFEDVTAALGLPFFNDDDGRSDNKGPEPEGIATGLVDNQRFAFIGLERVDSFFVYDVTDPTAPQLQELVPSPAGEEAPEGVLFIEAADTPTGLPWLAITHEDSGTVALYQLTGNGTTSARPIPTLDSGGLAVLVGLLMLLGFTAVRLRADD